MAPPGRLFRSTGGVGSGASSPLLSTLGLGSGSGATAPPGAGAMAAHLGGPDLEAPPQQQEPAVSPADELHAALAQARQAAQVADGLEDGMVPGDDSGDEAGGFSYYSGTSEPEEPLAQLSYEEPQDTAPLRRFVTRSSSFTQNDFEELLRSPGMFQVKDPHFQPSATLGRLGLARRRSSRQGLQQSEEHMLSRTSRLRRSRKRVHKSALRLPLVRPDNRYYIVWSTLVLCLDLTYSAFVVPISIGMMTSWFEANWTSICDYGAGALFFADLVINFHVGFIATYNMHKVLVMNPSLIAKYYVRKGSFFSDVFSTGAWLSQIVMVIVYHKVPSFNPDTAMYVMEGIRLMRFMRVIRLLKRLLSNVIYASISFEGRWLSWFKGQSFLYLVYIVYLILLLINFIGCLWNFVAGVTNYNNTWVNFYAPYVREYAADPLIGLTPQEAKQDVSDVWLYFSGVYWALTTITGVGYGDIVAASLVETIVTLGVQIVGVMFFGLLLSTISELLQQVNISARRAQMFRNKMDLVERWMAGLGLTAKLRRKIKTFYAEVWLRQAENAEETGLFLELPHVLRNEVSWHVNHNMFRRVPMLKDVDEKTLYLIASKMTPYRFGPGTDLCTEGDVADRLWVLLEGEVAALYHFNEAEHLHSPAVLGDSVLLQELDSYFSVYPCTYRTVTSCAIWQIEWKDLKMLLAFRPRLQEQMAVHVHKALAERITAYPHLWAHSLQRASAPQPTRWPTWPEPAASYEPDSTPLATAPVLNGAPDREASGAPGAPAPAGDGDGPGWPPTAGGGEAGGSLHAGSVAGGSVGGASAAAASRAPSSLHGASLAEGPAPPSWGAGPGAEEAGQQPPAGAPPLPGHPGVLSSLAHPRLTHTASLGLVPGINDRTRPEVRGGGGWGGPGHGGPHPEHYSTMPASTGHQLWQQLQRNLSEQQQQQRQEEQAAAASRSSTPDHYSTMPAAAGQRMFASLQRQLSRGHEEEAAALATAAAEGVQGGWEQQHHSVPAAAGARMFASLQQELQQQHQHQQSQQQQLAQPAASPYGSPPSGGPRLEHPATMPAGEGRQMRASLLRELMHQQHLQQAAATGSSQPTGLPPRPRRLPGAHAAGASTPQPPALSTVLEGIPLEPPRGLAHFDTMPARVGRSMQEALRQERRQQQQQQQQQGAAATGNSATAAPVGVPKAPDGHTLRLSRFVPTEGPATLAQQRLEGGEPPAASSLANGSTSAQDALQGPQLPTAEPPAVVSALAAEEPTTAAGAAGEGGEAGDVTLDSEHYKTVSPAMGRRLQEELHRQLQQQQQQAQRGGAPAPGEQLVAGGSGSVDLLAPAVPAGTPPAPPRGLLQQDSVPEAVGRPAQALRRDTAQEAQQHEKQPP